ncbi:MAG: nicotinamide mononucleotide transporter [Bacilli bacterium]|nr:nicotinamide mononucleotide transporter [Bacilli bacterium]
MKKLILELKSLKKFDVIWLVFCTIGITIVSLNTNNSLLAIIASIMGVIYVILNGCRLSVAFLFGIVNTFVYGIVSYQNGLYGDFMLNVFYSCPCCIIGLIAWFRASRETAALEVSSFPLKKRIIYFLIVVLAIVVYGTVLKYLKDTQPYLDATTTVLSVSAYICLILRKKEVWYLFNISNILSIVMWGINYYHNDANISILFMYIIYTTNSLLNTVKWELANRKAL